MDRRNNTLANIDWVSILLWLVILSFGWMNIYSANIMEAEGGIFDLSMRFGKQIMWIGASIILAILLLMLDAKFYTNFAYILYIIMVLILMAVLVIGTEVNGARSWFVIGGFQFQPSEFAKPLTALALAKLLTSHNFELRRMRDLFKAFVIIFIPPALILLQPDMGSTLVYFAFLFVLFREGFSANIMLLLAALMFLFFATLVVDNAVVLLILVLGGLLIYAFVARSTKKAAINGAWTALTFGALYGISRLLDTGFSTFTIGLFSLIPITIILFIKGLKSRMYSHLKILGGVVIAVLFMISVDYSINNILKPHQQHRIYVTLGIEDDPQGVGYNVNQSKIAIGSGGFKGKGYLNGTQTKLHFVPEQSTDFIFCTVGEEWGFLGTTFVILLYLGLLLRMIFLAERQRSAFSRIFGYSFVSIIFIHFLVNIGMTIGILPVIGIPLPFFSYGGSSLWAFSMFLFIFLRLDASRLEILS
ncbi:MAG: rod shape-determining protein RodA [Bacteroides sp.]|nr:rod shape-determining protein RodA [Bacteroides sp.]